MNATSQSKVNLRFIFDIVESYIGAAERDYSQKQITLNEYNIKVEVLEELKTSIESFIKEANKL